MEEKWEEEMIDNDGGISEWACLADDEKKGLRKDKWVREIFFPLEPFSLRVSRDKFISQLQQLGIFS